MAVERNRDAPGARWQHLSFQGGVCTNFAEQIVTPIRAFCGRNIDVRAVLMGGASPFHSAGDVVAKLYDQHLFKKATQRDLPDSPTSVLYATNMQTGRNFRFTRNYIANWHLGINEKQVVPLATAVAASAAFPPSSHR